MDEGGGDNPGYRYVEGRMGIDGTAATRAGERESPNDGYTQVQECARVQYLSLTAELEFGLATLRCGTKSGTLAKWAGPDLEMSKRIVLLIRGT